MIEIILIQRKMLYYVMIRNSIWKNNIAYKQIELVNHNLLLQITKCAAAGRDHLPCCLRRGVPVECQALCQGTQTHSENSVFGDCFAYIGNIMTCLEDGIIHIYYLHDFFELKCRNSVFTNPIFQLSTFISFRMDRSSRTSKKLPCNLCPRF